MTHLNNVDFIFNFFILGINTCIFPLKEFIWFFFQGETRRIDMIIVFGVTATFSIFAYVWLLVILKVSSPNVVDVWESVLTFLFFPILVVIAFSADKGWMDFLKCGKSVTQNGTANMTDKQRQIELGSFQPGESTYRTKLLYFFSSSMLFLLWWPTNNYIIPHWTW